MDRMKRLTEAIRMLIEGEFSGYIRINFSQGSLGRVEKFEEIEDAALMSPNSGRGNRERTYEERGRQTKEQGTPITAVLRKSGSSLVLFFFLLSPSIGLAAGEPKSELEPRIVQSGHTAFVHYKCRLKNGEVVAVTDGAAANEVKSNIFMIRNEKGAIPVTAKQPDAELVATHEETFEEEISDRLALKVTGMKEGESRRVELTAQNIPQRDEMNYVVRLARVRTRPKEMKMSVADYKAKTYKTPEVGQAFIIDPAFPGKVEAVTEADVIIRFSVRIGELIETPFGPGRIREEGQNYKVDIDASKGGLTRMGGTIGRIVDVDDRTIIVDYRNPFGGETLICDVAVEKIAEEKPIESGKKE